jgi:flagellar basal body rod protein FlgG
MSNVDMTVEVTDMIQAQRMFDLNAEALQLTDKMAEVANGIRA